MIDGGDSIAIVMASTKDALDDPVGMPANVLTIGLESQFGKEQIKV